MSESDCGVDMMICTAAEKIEQLKKNAIERCNERLELAAAKKGRDVDLLDVDYQNYSITSRMRISHGL